MTPLSGLLLALLAAQEPVRLTEPAHDFAVDPETGAVAALRPEKNQVVLYRKLGAGDAGEPVVVEVGKLPMGIAYKKTARRSVFAVVCQDVRKMAVLNAADLSLIKEIPLELESPGSCAASLNPADPSVWYCGGRGHESAAARVNLDTLQDEGKAVGGSRSSVMDMAVSADGALAYLRGPWSPSGFCAVQIVPPEGPGRKPKFVDVHYDHNSTPPYVPDALGDYTASGPQVYSRDLKRAVAKIGVTPLLFLPHKPFCLGVDKRDLVAVSLNSWKEVGRISLGGEMPAERAPGGRRGFGNPAGDFKTSGPRTRLLYAPQSDKLLLCSEGKVDVVALASLKLPDEVMLSARIDVPASLLPGRAARIDIRKTDPRASVELKEGPKGMRLDGSALAWTPAEEQVGQQAATIRLSAAGQERLLEVPLLVTRPHVPLGFVPQAVQVSPAGTWAVAFTNGGHRPDAREIRLVVVDLKAGALAAQRVLTAPLAAAAVDDDFVYAALADSDAFLVLRRSDLSDVKRLFTSGRVQQFLIARDHVLATSDRASSVFKRSAAGVEPATSPFFDATPPGFPGSRPRWVARNRLLVQGTVLDETLSGVKELRSATGFQSRSFVASGRMPAMLDRSTSGAWGVFADYNGLQRTSGQVIARFQSEALEILDDQPAAACLSVSRPQTRGAPIRADLVFRDLVSGNPGASLTLFEKPFDPQTGFTGGREGVRLAAAGNVLVALVQDSLYFVATPKLDPSKFPAPLHWRGDSGVHVLPHDGTLTLEAAASGGSAPLQYALQVEAPGIELDRSKGTLRVDGKKMADTIAQALVQQAVRFGGGTDAKSLHRDYLATAGPSFKRATGKDPAGIPYAILIGLTVQDSNNQTAQNEFVALLDLPFDLLARKLEESQPKRPDPADKARRIAEIERQIRELQAELERLRRE